MRACRGEGGSKPDGEEWSVARDGLEGPPSPNLLSGPQSLSLKSYFVRRQKPESLINNPKDDRI